jgi:hypothetical protein
MRETMGLQRIILIAGWIGVGMVLVDLHVYSPLPDKKLTHIGAIISGTCFVLLIVIYLISKLKR